MSSRDKRGWKAGFEAIPDDDSHRPIVAPARDRSHARIVTASAVWALIGQKLSHNKSPICLTRSLEKKISLVFLLPFVLLASLSPQKINVKPCSSLSPVIDPRSHFQRSLDKKRYRRDRITPLFKSQLVVA